MQKYLISLMTILVPVLAQAAPNCVKNPVYCQIMTLKPGVNKAFALSLSKSIAKYSRKFGVDPKISVAIAMQESGFENKNRMGTVLTKRNQLVHGITDVGVFQIHVNTIASFNERGVVLDTERLKTDVDYQAFWHAKILKKKISMCKAKRDKFDIEEGQEWSCYHSVTKKQRETYVDYVGPYIEKLSQ